jgi:hypothetical protein
MPMSEGLRLTVEASRYRAWRRAAPGLAVLDGPAERPEVMPPFVAAAFAVHVQAQATVSLRITGPGLRVSVHVSRAEALAAGVASARFGTGDEWVQVVLLRSELAAEEVVRWVPGAASDRGGGPPDDLPGGAAGIVPDGARLWIVALGAELVRWQARDGAWVDDQGVIVDPARLSSIVAPSLGGPACTPVTVAQP